ncbi:methylmalonyl-CoA mutase family protein [Nakamurella sp.]|uniref:methylmalonyl-CoA mutase family protein n=1 Tax=Nakamurella sp. TaxID=1869182 RepID=UPI00378321D7
MSELNEEIPLRLAVDDVTAQQWEQAAAAVLARMKRPVADPAQVWSALARTTIDGLTVPPLGTAERSAGQALSIATPGRAPAGWDVRAALFDQDPSASAAAAITELEGGATSLWLTVGGPGIAPADLPAALRGVHLNLAPVVVSAGAGVTGLQAATALAEVISAAPDGAAAGTGLGADPIGRLARSGDVPDPADVADRISDVLALATDLGVRGFVADGTVAHDRGAGDVDELAYTVAAGVEYLRAFEAAGLDIDGALGLLELRLAVTDEQFTSIAKLRAARVLWSRIGQLSGATPATASIHAVTSLPMTTRYDPWVNLLRTTVAAFAGGVGGADAVTVLPFDMRLGVPDAFGRRMARNISALLIEESHVAAVADPSAGAYAIEMLTHELAEAAWDRFLTIDRAGGVLAALGDGSLRAGWTDTATRRHGQVATRRRPLTGVSEFPNPAETLPARVPWPAPPEVPSWGADFEAMRDEPPADPVFLATLGTVAEHSARAAFVTNLLSAGGIVARSAGRTESVHDVVASYDGERVVLVVGADARYAEWGADVINGLRAAGATRIVLAGRPVPAVAELIDDHIAVGQDVVEFLRRVRDALLKVAAR